MRAGKIVALVVGALAAMVAFALLVGGGAVTVMHGAQRDGDDFYTSGLERLRSDAFAVTGEHVDLVADIRNGHWVPDLDLGTIRLEAAAVDGRPVFVGIARQDDIDAYLAGSAHDELTDISKLPSHTAYRHAGGTVRPSPPEAESFWVTSTAGPGEQSLRWEVEQGEWGVVVMNRDGSPGVEVDARIGVKTGLLLPIGVGLLVGGALLAGVAVVLLVVALRRDHDVVDGDGDGDGAAAASADPASPPAPTSGTAYPVRIEGALDPRLGRGLWLVKWFLAIPHLVVLAFLWAAFFVLTMVAGVAVLFTGRYPRPVFDFNVGVLRWTWRVTFYAIALGTDRYPPFSLDADPSYPADLDVAYPERLSRGLVLVKSWLLALPHYLVLAVFGGGMGWWGWSRAADDGGLVSGGLVIVVAVIAGVALLFSGRYPPALFDFLMGMQRWTYRVYAYAALMTDEYPPFRFDAGGPDPGSAPPVGPPPAPDRGGELVGAR